MTKVGVVGSRGFSDLGLVRDFIYSLTPGTIVVSGGARGVDSAAESFAKRCGLEVVVFRPDRSIIQSVGFGRAAAARNKQIVQHSDRIVAFWDGTSAGTQMTIGFAREAGKPVQIISADAGKKERP